MPFYSSISKHLQQGIKPLFDTLFLNAGRLLLLAFLLLAVLAPLLAIFWRGMAPDASQGGGVSAAIALFSSENFHWLLGNSLKVSLTVTLLVVPLAYLFAYALQCTLIPSKAVWRG